jgi:hypothetical protein
LVLVSADFVVLVPGLNKVINLPVGLTEGVYSRRAVEDLFGFFAYILES